MKTKTLKEWEEQLDQVLLDIRKCFLKLGETLYLAGKELNKEDYLELVGYVNQWGLKDADINAAIAAFLHTRRDLGNEKSKRIDPALVFSGAKNSKILAMDDQDQQRLLTGEKFDILMSNGKPDKPKTFADMSDVQRNMLIGKGGKILNLTEQLTAMSGNNRNNVAVQELGSIESTKNKITLSSRDGKMVLFTTYDVLARMLLAENCVDALVSAIKDAQQGMGCKKVI